MVKFVREHGLEGIVAKREDSVYQPGLRTDNRCKQRLNRGQEFVVGGDVPSHLGVDSLVVGFYQGKDLYYAARVLPALCPRRAEGLRGDQASEDAEMSIRKPARKRGRKMGPGIDSGEDAECVWLMPEAVAQIEFLEWTGANHIETRSSSACEMKRIRTKWCERVTHPQFVTYGQILTTAIIAEARFDSRRRAPGNVHWPVRISRHLVTVQPSCGCTVFESHELSQQRYRREASR